MPGRRAIAAFLAAVAVLCATVAAFVSSEAPGTKFVFLAAVYGALALIVACDW